MQNSEKSRLESYSEYIEPETLKALTAFLESDDIPSLEKSASAIGSAFGSSKEIKLLLSSVKEERETSETKLLNSFHNNLQLLVQKTWVEKSDETVKDQLVVRLDSICTELKDKKYKETYAEVLSVLNEAVVLMFGDNSTSKDDFTEYALRIDPDFGTFWCFLQSLPNQAEWQPEKIRMALLLEMSFLANY